MYERRRNIVMRADGRRVNVARFRGQLFVCSSGCCCGRTEDGFAPVPADRWHAQWEQRGLRNLVHLTVGGCLGPCGLANVVLLLFEGQALWFHSMNSESLVDHAYDYIERVLAEGKVVPPGRPFDAHQFTASSWQPRPDGAGVDDRRPRHLVQIQRGSELIPADGGPELSSIDRGQLAGASGDGIQRAGVVRAVAMMEGETALPRRNGELVFEEPWHGRAFGMAVALHEAGVYEWEEFRRELIKQIRTAESAGGKFVYYEAWLAALEAVLASKGAMTAADLDEVTYQFEYGERDDVY